MGTEKNKFRPINRNKPPPIPPRPQHLIPVKTMSKYSSMPDILNGWKRDTNPDLLKLNMATLSTKTNSFDINGNCHLVNGVVTNYYKNSPKRELKKLIRNYNGNSDDNNYISCNLNSTSLSEKNSNGKVSRKFSCIPRSNSKKKKNVLSSTDCSYDNSRNNKSSNRSEISQTSWYVKDVGNTTVQLSKCEITLNCDNNCRYALEEEVPATASNSKHANNSFYKLRYKKKSHSSMASSTSLSGLPPLPKSLSDASLLWNTTEKKISSHPMNVSPSGSSASSSSRTSGIFSKAPLLSSPRNSVSQDMQKSSISHIPVENAHHDERRPTPPPPPTRKPTSLDLKLATLRREMYDLRQMDLALLSQLWSLNEAIVEFRQMQVSLSPNSPSLHSSDEEDSGCYYSNVSSQGMVTSNQHSNTLGSSSSRSSISTTRSTLRDNLKS